MVMCPLKCARGGHQIRTYNTFIYLFMVKRERVEAAQKLTFST